MIEQNPPGLRLEPILERQDQVVVFCLIMNGCVLLEKREAFDGELFHEGVYNEGDLFVLPGGKIKDGETPNEAFLREFEEEVGTRAEGASFVSFFGSELAPQNPLDLADLCTIHLYLVTGWAEVIDEETLSQRNLYWVPLLEAFGLGEESRMGLNSAHTMLFIAKLALEGKRDSSSLD